VKVEVGFRDYARKHPIACDKCGHSELVDMYNAGMSNQDVYYCEKNRCTISIGWNKRTTRMMSGINLEWTGEEIGQRIADSLAPCGCGANYLPDEYPKCLRCGGHLRVVLPPQTGELPWTDRGIGIIFERHFDAGYGFELLTMSPAVTQELVSLEIGPEARAGFATNSTELSSSASVRAVQIDGARAAWIVADGQKRYLIIDRGHRYREVFVYQMVRLLKEDREDELDQLLP
jgi:hypothetical protein